MCYYHSMIIRTILLFVAIIWFFSSFFVVSALTTYIPGAHITMTGSNSDVFFDVGDDIFMASTTASAPTLHTLTETFSWAFYLSGAGWIDFSTGSYQVELDCGIQSLNSLSTPCILSGTGYGELIGDVMFDGYVLYHPDTGLLSGTASTWVWVYDFSGVSLPLRPAAFTTGNSILANHQASLSVSGTILYGGTNPWELYFQPISWSDTPYLLGDMIDFSHASIYRAEIRDPDGWHTIIDDFRVLANLPSSTLSPGLAGSIRESFCTTIPAWCIDGAALSPMTLSITGGPRVANGVDSYAGQMKLRDRYGNQVQSWDVSITYNDKIRDIQTNLPLPYMSMSPILWMALNTTGDIMNTKNGSPSTNFIPANIGDVNYTLASIAPTSATDTLTLSWVLYRDSAGVITDVTMPAWKVPLVFTPWYSTSLAAGPILVGETVDFTTNYTHTTLAPIPQDPRALYDIRIGDNTIAAFDTFSSPDTIYCTKYTASFGIGECNWFGFPDPVIVSSEALSFSGIYAYAGYEPPPELVSYRSYITYIVWWVRILYPSGASDLGMATPWDTPMKILGQQNLSPISGINTTNISQVWNTLRKNITLLSRNRTNYSDVNYMVVDGDITVDQATFDATSPKKRTIVSLWGDITLMSSLSGAASPIALIALSDISGSGGYIHIDASVTDIEATLFAEKSIFSTGAHQLYIRGSVISHNSVSNTTCPYYVSPCVAAPKYNLQNLRRDFLDTPGTLSTLLWGKYSAIPLIIEYDGRVLSDPPPGLEK